MDRSVLIVASVDGAKFPVRKAIKGGELVIADDQHFNALGLFE